MKIPRSVAVGLFVALNFKTADKWTADKLAQKLTKIEENVDEDTVLDDKQKKNLAKIKKAIADEETFEIEDDTPAAEEAPAKPVKPAKPVAKAAEETEEEEAEAEAPAKPTKAAKAATTTTEGGKGVEKKKAEKPAKAPKAEKEEKEPGPSKVRESKSRPYVAGKAIAQLGFAGGVNRPHIDIIDAVYGKPNDHQSWFVLRTVWHGIRGYLEEMGIDPATLKKPAKAAKAAKTAKEVEADEDE